MGQKWDCKGRGLYFFVKGNENHQLGTGSLVTTEYYQQLR